MAQPQILLHAAGHRFLCVCVVVTVDWRTQLLLVHFFFTTLAAGGGGGGGLFVVDANSRARGPEKLRNIIRFIRAAIVAHPVHPKRGALSLFFRGFPMPQALNGKNSHIHVRNGFCV